MERIRLEIPARPDFVHVVRLVLAGVAAAGDFSYEGLDDLRLAADEACAQLLQFGPPASTLSIDVGWGQEGVEVHMWTDATDGAGWPPAALHTSLARHVLDALADRADLTAHDGHPSIRFSKRRS
jgi:serine/threonine-protein kinase RsbW